MAVPLKSIQNYWTPEIYPFISPPDLLQLSKFPDRSTWHSCCAPSLSDNNLDPYRNACTLGIGMQVETGKRQLSVWGVQRLQTCIKSRWKCSKSEVYWCRTAVKAFSKLLIGSWLSAQQLVDNKIRLTITWHYNSYGVVQMNYKDEHYSLP